MNGTFTRDGAMEVRVARALEDRAAPPAGIERVRAALRLAMEPRRALLRDPQHPEFLHPGRTGLVLILDAELWDPLALAAAALVESERPELRVPLERIRAGLGPEVAARVRAVPLPGEGAAEALLTAPREAALVALAERLDHCRHARFWPDPAARRRILAEAEAVYGPIAERVDRTLARRYRHWAGAFARSLARTLPEEPPAEPR